jgi:hypothetical protein
VGGGGAEGARALATHAVQEIYDGTAFPHMRARWDRYPDHGSHVIFPGCFRCHGSDLATEDGTRISDSCDLCHTIVAQGTPGDLKTAPAFGGLAFEHPFEIAGADSAFPCFHCHAGDSTVVQFRWPTGRPMDSETEH